MALEKIGPYKFQGVLGRGGMGTVYRGTHESTGELVAIKVLAPTYAHDDHFRGRFESEIKALIKLDHRNIVRLISYGQDDAMLYFSMELVEGNSLFQMQRRGHRFDWREILSIAKDVAHGLRHAHDRGIIHRDLKPGNLLMTMDEQGKPDYVKITDFGIAKRFGSSQNTGENVLGTMDFMSPEQAKGDPVTIRSDLYSLGTVMFTLLSGRPPFSSNSVEESLRNLTRVPAPRVSSMVPEVPRELDDLIKRLMAKRPENRIQTTTALLHQIEEAESTLRDYSEARTAQRPAPQPTDDTFDVGVPNTKANTSSGPESLNAQNTNAAGQTIEFTDHSEPLNPLAEAQEDYFNTVTDEHRNNIDDNDHINEPKKQGIIPLLFALLVVIGLAGYGISRAYQPADAEELYSQIERNSEQPHKALDEMDLFLEHYPDDDRADSVANMKRVGEAISLFNSLSSKLRVNRGFPGESRLTEIENQFLSIVDLVETKPNTAMAKMAAFVKFHQGSKLGIRDQKCVDAAQGYAIKIDLRQRSKTMDNVRLVRAALARATREQDPDEGIEIYESILSLYGRINWGNSEEAKEGRDLIKKAKDMLNNLREAKQKAEAAELELSNAEPTDDANDSSNTKE
ncbi:MAG: serine/threonine protein kinase [Mariniblastus sp.]|jgi:serine/threonine protein kinase